MDCRVDRRHETGSQAAFLPARTFAHLARCAAAIFLLAAADNVRLGLTVVAKPLEVLFAQRAFCAKLIFFRAAAERVRPLREVPPFKRSRTASALSKLPSCFAKLILSTLRSDTRDINPFGLAMSSPSVEIVTHELRSQLTATHPKSSALKANATITYPGT
jgi:hypothetical protein